MDPAITAAIIGAVATLVATGISVLVNRTRVRRSRSTEASTPAQSSHHTSASTSLATPRLRLPARTPHWVGRQPIIEDICTDLASCSAVLLHGVAGVGKTTLAIEIGHRLEERFCGRVTFLDAAGKALDSCMASLAEALDDGSLHDRRAELRSSDLDDILAKSPTLLVLDGVDSYDLLHALPKALPSAKLLLTSRLSGFSPFAKAYSVPPLPLGDACELFLRSSGMSSAAGTASLADLEALCEAVGRLPLALVLLATRARLLCETPTQLLERVLGGPLAALEPLQEADDIPGIAASFGVSFTRLPRRQRALFESLGVLKSASFDHDVAGALAGRSDVRADLAYLVSISLVEARRGSHYALHPLVGEYARSLLNARMRRRALFARPVALLVRPISSNAGIKLSTRNTPWERAAKLYADRLAGGQHSLANDVGVIQDVARWCYSEKR